MGTGTTSISATMGGVSGTTTLTVTPATVGVDRGDPGQPPSVPGLTQQFTATGTYRDASTADLTG